MRRWPLRDKGYVTSIALHASRMGRALLDFALPPRCAACRTIVDEVDNFCATCWGEVEFLSGGCVTCGLPLAGTDAEQCAACLAAPPLISRTRAAVAYGPVARKVALKLKYGGRPGLAETLARFMDRHIAMVEPDAVIAPVPLHRWRIWKRGYNQAALIARSLARRTQREARLDLLRRIKATPSLRGLGRRERALAVRGAFAVDPRSAPLVAGRTIVLVDDVYTSGATAGACARALKRAGAARVDIICWARVVATNEQ